MSCVEIYITLPHLEKPGVQLEIEVMIYIGTAGWAISKELKDYFPLEGSHLERYAKTFNTVEINSSFYRNHRPKTYARWSDSVPEHFLFSVKLFKEFTHIQKLNVELSALEEVLTPLITLKKYAVLLVQLPPSLKFDYETAEGFFEGLRRFYLGPVAVEPRHVTWGSKDAFEIFKDFQLTKVEADPELCPGDFEGTGPIDYIRLHGSPEIYASNYEDDFLSDLKNRVTARFGSSRPTWVIFDNTMYGHATRNAFTLKSLTTRRELEILG